MKGAPTKAGALSYLGPFSYRRDDRLFARWSEPVSCVCFVSPGGVHVGRAVDGDFEQLSTAIKGLRLLQDDDGIAGRKIRWMLLCGRVRGAYPPTRASDWGGRSHRMMRGLVASRRGRGMTQKILGPEGSKRRKRFWLVPMLAALFAVVFYVAGAQAVHDAGIFQLDKNASTAVNPPPTALEDWDLICKAARRPALYVRARAMPSRPAPRPRPRARSRSIRPSPLRTTSSRAAPRTTTTSTAGSGRARSRRRRRTTSRTGMPPSTRRRPPRAASQSATRSSISGPTASATAAVPTSPSGSSRRMWQRPARRQTAPAPGRWLSVQRYAHGRQRLARRHYPG